MSVLRCPDPADDVTVVVDNDEGLGSFIAGSDDHGKVSGLPGDSAGVDPDGAGFAGKQGCADCVGGVVHVVEQVSDFRRSCVEVVSPVDRSRAR